MPAPVLALVLATIAVLLAAPVSVWLSRAHWPSRAPAAALVLWQAVCLTAGLAMVEALLVVAVAPLGTTLWSGVGRWIDQLLRGRPFAGMTVSGWIAGALATATAIALLAVLIRSCLQVLRQRRAHRVVLDLLTGAQVCDRVVADVPAGVRILDHSAAIAYTLPGWHSRVVLTAGLVDLLDRDQLQAVIEHERAHVRSRHDLLVLPFQAWAAALGRLPGVREAAVSVSELTEMLADDLAARRCSRSVLARALAIVALSGPDAIATGSMSVDRVPITRAAVARRVGRLVDRDPLPPAGTVLVFLAAALLLVIPFLALAMHWR